MYKRISFKQLRKQYKKRVRILRTMWKIREFVFLVLYALILVVTWVIGWMVGIHIFGLI